MSEDKQIGVVSSYFVKAEVAAIKLSDSLKIGDKVHIKGNTTDFEQEVASIQIDQKDVKNAGKGSHIGIKVLERVRPNDLVFVLK